MTEPVFVTGRSYTRRGIHEKIGGSIQSVLPTVGGHVVCACLTPKKNPDAPEVILVDSKPLVEKNGRSLSEQAGRIPVFMKAAPDDWRYVGDYGVEKWTDDPDEIEPWVRRAGRDNVRLAIFMKL